MSSKVTLITPPDIYQSDRISLFFIDVTEKEQQLITELLGSIDDTLELNIYFFQGEVNVPWFLHALACSTYKYINLNNLSAVSSHLSSYALSKSNVYFSVNDENIASLYSHINCNRVASVTDFLEIIINGKN